MSGRSSRAEISSEVLQSAPAACPFLQFSPLAANDNTATSQTSVITQSYGDDHSRYQSELEHVAETAARVLLPSRTPSVAGDTRNDSSCNAPVRDDTPLSHDAISDEYTVSTSTGEPEGSLGQSGQNADHTFQNRPNSDNFSAHASGIYVDPPPSMPLDKGLDPDSQALADYIIQGIRTIKAEGTNGWAEISNTLNDIDDEKLDHCKDDIDTLLVFAGLFSAVLTAFVIESYTALSPDPTSAMIQLLAQISVQTSSYTVTPSFMNATSSVPVSFAFEPSPTALRVNRLWFISLILSLITASFGILIKQWLREYKAVDAKYANLRSRLRIRQFRYPGLIKWKVFEIAALLPLFMQAALGLFLLGLCFFTWDVNPSIGQSTTVLVSAWVFFFVAAAFAPALSSDCPYKFALLTPVLRVLRAQLPRFWSLNWLYVGPKVYSHQPWQFDRIAFKWIIAVVSAVVHFVAKTVCYLLGLLCCCCLCCPIPRLSLTQSVTSIAYDMETSLRSAPLEEAKVAKDEHKELAILITVDDVLLDDELLGTDMRSIIAQTQFRPEEVVKFLAEVLQHRLPQLQEVLRTAVVAGFPVTNLRPLSPRAWQGIANIIYDTLQQYAYKDQDQPGLPPWVNDALTMLASRVDDKTAATWNPLLAPLFLHYDLNLREVAPGAFAGMPFRDVWAHLQRLLPISAFEDPMRVMCCIHRGQYCLLQCRHDSPLDQARSHCPSWDDQAVINDIVLGLLANAVAQGTCPSESAVQSLCAVVSWATCRCHNVFQDTLRKDFLMRYIKLIQSADETFVKNLMSAPLSKELALLWRSQTLDYGVDDPGDRVILGAFNLAVGPLTHPGGGLTGFSYPHPVGAYFGCFYEQTLIYYNSVTEPELPNREQWMVLLHLVGDIMRYGLRVPERSREAHSERLHASQLASDALINHWSPPHAILYRHHALLPYWMYIIEALHLYLLPEAEPFRGQPGSHCSRGAINAKFKKETLDTMASRGWNINSYNGTHSIIEWPCETASRCPVFEDRLAAILGTMHGPASESRAAITAGERDSEEEGEGTDTPSGDSGSSPSEGVVRRAVETLRSLLPVRKTDSDSFTGTHRDRTSPFHEARKKAAHQHRTCVQLDGRSYSRHSHNV